MTMTITLAPYPAYKDSGVPWLGNVPAHWEIRKLRSVLRVVTERNRPDLPLLSVVREKGVILRDVTNQNENHNYIPDDLTNYKVVRQGQFAMNKMKAWQGSYGISQYDGIVSPAYFIFDVADGLQGSFFHAAIRSKAYVPFFTQASDGVRIGQWDLSKARMGEIPFFVPTLPEQHAIARFLDHIDGRINRTIRAKRKLIALLNEQKQAIIHRAVTRGLDPDVALRPSGVEWLGDIPEHWEAVRLGHHIDLLTGFPFKSEGFSQDSQDIRLLRGINVALGLVRWSKVVYWPIRQREGFSDYELQVGDIVLGLDRPVIQGGVRVAVVSDADVPSLLLQRVARVRPHHQLAPDFLVLLLTGKSFTHYLAPIFTGISVPHLSPEQVRSFQFALPSLDEQYQIVERLAMDVKGLEIAITQIQREIALLREYRTRLIADVVTGKLDVRAAAAGLPEGLAAGEEWAAEESAEWDEAAEPMDAEEILG